VNGSVGAWLPQTPCTPRKCLTDPAPTVSGPRRLARYLAGGGVLFCGIVLSPLVRWCSPAHRNRLTMYWCRAVIAALGVRIRIAGGRSAGGAQGALVVANHVSWLDIPLVAAVRPGRMVAKSEIASYPVLGWLTARGGTIFLERDRLRALPGTVARMAAALRSGSTVVVFPEGGTWCGREQGRFRPASFQAAIDASIPVQPLRIRYRWEDGRTAAVAAFVGEDTLLASLRRVAAARGLVAEVTVAPPLAPGPHTDRGTMARAAQAVCMAGVRTGEPLREGGCTVRSARPAGVLKGTGGGFPAPVMPA
jgi:1-acyl-sn-glycerol-3-phosphate acyltransferase